MFKNISKFQLVLMGAFVFFTISGLLMFSFYSNNKSKQTVLVTVWGTLSSNFVQPYLEQVIQQNPNKIKVVYTQKTPQQFNADLLEALATDKGPDVILASQDEILKQSNKLYTIPYSTFSATNFKSAFISEGGLFLTPQGVLAMPFGVDPMVMYWNRDIFTNANISVPPKTWDEFRTLTPALTKKDAALNITQSAVALGEYRNVDYAKDILSLLIMQAGNPITTLTSSGAYQTALSSSLNYAIAPANAALTFYTQFADPLKQNYTWNRALPSSKTLFLSNKLGMYFGYASEYAELRGKNPNLNFNVALMPQVAQQDTQTPVMTFGKLYGFAILKSSRNMQAAYNDILLLTSKGSLGSWTRISGLPSVRSDSLMINASDAASAIFATSALRARGWYDPDRGATETIFKNMIEGVTSGRQLYNEAVSDAENQLQMLIDTVNQHNLQLQ